MKECTVQELLDLFLQTNNLQQLIGMAALVLKNPLLLCDTSYHFIGRSDTRGVKDRSWLAGMKRGFWTYELVSMINGLDLDYSGQEHKTQILTNINAESTARRKIGTLCIDGAHLGYYFILEEWTTFEDIPEQTYQQVEMILAKCMCTERSLQSTGMGGNGERLILDLLQNDFESRKLFLERAAKHELSRLGTYRVFCIPLKEEGTSVTDAGARDIRSVIGQCLPLSWQVFIQGCIVVLADFSVKIYQSGESLERFEAFLGQRNLHAGQSDCFSDPYYLKRHFEQAYAAAYLGQTFRDERPVIPYEDYKIYNLFLNVREEEELFTQYSSESIRKIYEYDQKNGTEYLETIHQYLANGCSIKKAAEKLYVHRNTVAYRVSRVRELFGLDFDDHYKNYLNFTSCLLRRYCDFKSKK